MHKALGLASILFLVTLSAGASTITWGSASLSDDNGGAFLAGSSTSAVGTLFTLNLPSYSVSNFSYPPDEVDLGITVTDTATEIIGVTWTYYGTFTGDGLALFVQNPTDSGSFNVASYSNSATFAATNTLNLSTQFNLAAGDSAAVTGLTYELTLATPEPMTMSLLGSGLAFLFAKARRRTRR